jgi:uridine phosphorylase
MEMRPLVRKLKLRKESTAGVSTYAGTVGGRPVVAITTGVGKRLAAQGVEALLSALPLRRIIVVGIAGATDNTPIGTPCRPEAVVDAATGARYIPENSGDGELWTTDRVITDPAEVASLRSRGVIALDMETAAVAAVAERHKVSWSVCRAISDRATDGILDAEMVGLSDQNGTPNWGAVARLLLRHPGRIRKLARLAHDARQATERAATEAVRAALSQK